MAELQLALALLVIAVNLAAAALGGIAWRRDRPSLPFWYVLRAGQLAVLAQVAAELAFYLAGHRADDQLHYLYVILPLAASLLAEGTRAGAAAQELGGADFQALSPQRQRQVGLAIVRRETGVMAIGALVIAFLAWRGLATAGGMF